MNSAGIKRLVYTHDWHLSAFPRHVFMIPKTLGENLLNPEIAPQQDTHFAILTCVLNVNIWNGSDLMFWLTKNSGGHQNASISAHVKLTRHP